MNASMQFAKNIKILCRQEKVPMGLVTDNCGVCRAYLSHCSRKTGRAISLDTAYKMASFFGMTIDEVINL